MPQRPVKKRKIAQTPTELIESIPPPPDYYPLPYLQINRRLEVRLPIGTETDPYSLFKLFLTDNEPGGLPVQQKLRSSLPFLSIWASFGYLHMQIIGVQNTANSYAASI
jgi:hypothetical protein